VVSTAGDEELMQRFCDGEAPAFDVLFTRHAAAVHAFHLRMTRDEEQARDLTQATFLSVVRARGRWTRGVPFAPWLFAVAANAARDGLRRKRRRPEEPAEIAPEALAVAAHEPDPGLEGRVRAALLMLPEQQREAVLLHRFHGLAFEEIARSIGTTVGAAKVRAHRGYQRLRELLRDDLEEGS
jgi:RNA polymerase sigma factor (sigma-70 family)